MLKSRTSQAFFALAVLALSSIQISTIADAKDKKTGGGNSGEIHTTPSVDGSTQTSRRKSPAQRRTECLSRARADWVADERVCRNTVGGKGLIECLEVIDLAYEMEQGKCNRIN